MDKGLVYCLSHDGHFDVACDVSIAHCRSSSGDSVGLQSWDNLYHRGLTFALRYFPHLYVLSATVLTQWVAPPKMFCNWYRI